MQTWAKRGMQAALVTGGMLAAGTGVASASDGCASGSAPLGGPKLTPLEAAGDGTPRTSGPCYSGELFPERSRPATTITGVIDPVRDLLPAVENSMTQQIPRITDEPRMADEPRAERSAPRAGAQKVEVASGERVWIPPEEAEQVANRIRTLELAGWVADAANPGGPSTGGSITPVPGHPTAAVGLLSRDEGVRGRHAAQRQFGTPADGYHRSLRWSGPIGSVVDSPSEAARSDDAAPAEDVALPSELVRPTIDPAVVEGFDRADSLISLWDSVRGRAAASESGEEQPQAALLSPQNIDLTSAVLGGGPTLHTVPSEVLASALTSRPAAAVQQEFEPLHVPGEHQMGAAEVPDLTGVRSASSAPAGGSGAGVVLPAPGLGKMHALGGGELDVLDGNRIVDALQGNRHPLEPAVRPREAGSADSGQGRFAAAPHRLDVTAKVVDELTAAVPERDVVTRNPFREAPASPAAAAGGMALPVLDGPVTPAEPARGSTPVAEGTPAGDMTVPLPRVDADGNPVSAALDTAAPLRDVSGRF